ncbi:geranylgeranyl reductase family protein [Methanolinea mesophila]|uniref:NAD(P)/FAD-dependent oxidoreductase n=1 Tax=Methanolinea mesophila TaxID=547055 RepID=UPI001FD82C7C|nr:NAD(P)/FAD-dependent oxidoreductase [Methanolinea mesophila]MBP1928189.1 geranylgeranyl reductase family protein [Methanolinea mesophila]
MIRTMSGTGYDVVVVGAGPAGSACARRCAELGLSCLLLEEHATIGHPVQCAGLLSLAAMRECRVSARSVLNRVSGARIRTAHGTELAFDAGTTKAFVVDRGILDREMAALAAGAGAEIRVKTACAGVRERSVITRGVNGREEFPFRVLIAADGPRSPVARARGMTRPPVFLAGLQTEIPLDIDPRFVEIYPDVSPEFFGWVIPSGTGRARVGLAGMEDIRGRFHRLLSTVGAGPEECGLHLVTGTIPLGVMPRTFGNRTLFIGDAAGMAKPTSGGGVYTGVRSAVHAAETAALACREHDFTDESLARYEGRWKADIGKELALGFRVFSARRAFGPVEMDRLVRMLSRDEVVQEIILYGDMDRPGVLLKRFAKNPRLYPVLWLLLREGVRGIIK